ncbi:MAG: type III pantothenate kinase [Oscillospiraceae bacterium]|nr:type III pantothenate kinase [Oscillospiraceae bacterium]
MILTIDIGNSNVNVGLFEGENLVSVFTFSTDTKRTAEQYAIELKAAAELKGQSLASVDGAIISSVVPPLTSTAKKAVKLLCGVDALVLGPGVKNGLNIKIDNPAQLGADLVADAVGALAHYPTPCLVIDLGTATKISVIDKAGAYRGCTISAGVKISLAALADKTAQLPAIDLSVSECPAYGTNTVHSMQAGILLGTACMLDGLCDRIEDSLGEKIASVVATGGISGNIIPHLKRKVDYAPYLILEGLRVIYEKNCR